MTLKEKINDLKSSYLTKGAFFKTGIPLAGAGFLGFHLFQGYKKDTKIDQWPAMLGSVMGYYAGPVFMDKMREVTSREGKERDWYAIMLKFSSGALGGVVGMEIGQQIVADYLKNHSKEELAEDFFERENISSQDINSQEGKINDPSVKRTLESLTIPSMLVVPATVFALELLPKPSNTSYQQRTLSGLAGGFAGQVIGRQFENKLLNAGWNAREVDQAYNFSRTGGVLLGAAAGGTLGYQVMKRIILD